LDLSGALARMGLPVPRLPFLIGSAVNLSAKDSIYPRMVKLDVPINPTFTSLVAGNVATAIALQITTLCQNWTSFQNLFGEYAIVGARLELRFNAAVNPQGLVVVYIDEKTSAAPTAAIGLSAPHLDMMVQNTESPSRHLVEWKAADVIDIDWTSTSSGADVPAYLKVFANTASTGTSATTTGQVCITGALALCFRGYQSPSA
jgi:hypothetical protein